MLPQQTTNNELQTSMSQLADLVTDAVAQHAVLSPVYQNITTEVLKVLGSESEIQNMETKNLIKLLEVAGKAQINPIEQLTKLVQSLTALHDQQQMKSKMTELQAIVDHIQEEAGRKIIVSDVGTYSKLDELSDED